MNRVVEPSVSWDDGDEDSGGQGQVSTPFKICSNASQLEAYLPQPGLAWKWSQCALDKSLLQWMSQQGHIRRVGDGRIAQQWETSEEFWSECLRLLGTTEDGLGESVGQEKVLSPSQWRRVQTDRDPQPARAATTPSRSMRAARARQATLTGGSLPCSEVQLMREEQDHVSVNESKGNDPDDPRADAGQARLPAFGVVPTLQGTHLSTPTAKVY